MDKPGKFLKACQDAINREKIEFFSKEPKIAVAVFISCNDVTTVTVTFHPTECSYVQCPISLYSALPLLKTLNSKGVLEALSVVQVPGPLMSPGILDAQVLAKLISWGCVPGKDLYVDPAINQVRKHITKALDKTWEEYNSEVLKTVQKLGLNPSLVQTLED